MKQLLKLLQTGFDRVEVGHVAGVVQNFGVANLPFAIDDVGGALADALEAHQIIVERLVIAGDGLVKIRKQGKVVTLFFGPRVKCKGAVGRDAEDLAVQSFVILERVAHAAELAGADFREGERYEQQQDVVAAQRGKFYIRYLVGLQGEIRRL